MNTLATPVTMTPNASDTDSGTKGFHAAAELRLSAPMVDTLMVVTLDQLLPYDQSPRKTRNPLHEKLKESIRARGLDQPPLITRRPGEKHYIIRNGGNTRLAILNELWKETRDKRFFRIHCLFRHWESEASILAGHFVENELRANPSFIEKAIALKRLKELYEEDVGGKKMSQNEFFKRLKKEGFPVARNCIRRMLDCVIHLLPSIPQCLHAGLETHTVERLLNLHGGLSHIVMTWGKSKEAAFTELWQSTLSEFDSNPETFNFTRMQDEMIGRLSRLVERDYRMILLDLEEISKSLPDTKAAPEYQTTASREGSR